MNATAPQTGGPPAVTAIVYYIPAAAAIELYVPSIRSCTPINLRHDRIPSRKELQEHADERVTNYYARQGTPRPAGPVQLEFRVPREDELIPADPPQQVRWSSPLGYTVPCFGHIDPGYVRSHTRRLPGAEPVDCPPNWFKEEN
jgi:hypothetical protein